MPCRKAIAVRTATAAGPGSDAERGELRGRMEAANWTGNCAPLRVGIDTVR